MERGLLLCLALSLCHAQAHTRTHTLIFGVWVPDWMQGETPLLLWGSDLSFLQAQMFPGVEKGGSQVASGIKSTFKFPSSSAVVALKFFWVCAGCGDRGHCQHGLAAACPLLMRCERAPHPPHPALLPSPGKSAHLELFLGMSMGILGTGEGGKVLGPSSSPQTQPGMGDQGQRGWGSAGGAQPINKGREGKPQRRLSLDLCPGDFPGAIPLG